MAEISISSIIKQLEHQRIYSARVKSYVAIGQELEQRVKRTLKANTSDAFSVGSVARRCAPIRG